jgi:hypothetical protein
MIQDHLSALYTLAAQDPQDPDHKDAKCKLIRLRCLSCHNAPASLRALPTDPTRRFDDESFAFVLRIILMSLIPFSSLQVRCFCGKASLSSVHAQVCTVTHQQSHRHDNIVDILVRAFPSPRKEQPTTTGNRRWDLVFPNLDLI